MGVITKIAIRNMARRKVRYALTVITLIISVALFGGVMIVSDSFNIMMLRSIDEQMGTADVLIKPANSTGGWFNSSEIDDEVRSVPHVNYVAYRITGFDVFVSPTNSGNQVDNSTKTGVNGLDTQDVAERNLGAQPYIIDTVNPQKSVETLLEYADAKTGDRVVVISESLKIELGKDFEVNDSVWILPNEGELLGYNKLDTGTWLEYTVVAIIRDSGEARDFDPENPSEGSMFGGGGGQGPGIFANINNTHELVDGTTNHTKEFNLCVVGTDDLYSIGAVTQNILTKLTNIDDDRDWKVNDLKSDSLEMISTTMSILETVFLMFGLISLILSIVLMMNIFNIIKKEQEYETGMLQAVGASKSETFRLFLTQGIVMGVIGATIGTIFSYVISYVIFSVTYQTIQTLTETMGGFGLSGFEIILYPSTLILTFVIGLVSCIVAALYPSWKASRKPIIECLNPIEEKSRREKKHYIRRIILFIIGGLIIFMGFWLMGNAPETTGSFSPEEGMPQGMALGMFAPIFVLFGILWLMALSIKPLNKAFIILFSPYLRKTKLLTEKNMLRHRKRTVLTYIMIALTTSFLIGMSVMMDSIRAGIDTTINNFMGADVRVYTFNTPRSFETGLLNQTGVADVMGVTHQNAQINIDGDWVGHSLLDSDWNESISVNVVDTEKIKLYMTSTTIVSPAGMSLAAIMDELKAGNNIVIEKEFAQDHGIGVGENLSVRFSLGISYANLSALLAGENYNAYEDIYVMNLSVIAIVSDMQGFSSMNLLGGGSSGVSYNVFISWETYEQIAINNLPGGGTDMVFRQRTQTGNSLLDMVQPNWFNFSNVEAILNGMGGVDYYTTRMDYFTLTDDIISTNMTSVVGIQTNSTGNLKSDSLFGNNILVDKKIGYLGTTMEELLNTTEYVCVVDESYIQSHPGSGIGTNITIFPQEFILKTIQAGNFPYMATVVPYLYNYTSFSGSAVNLTFSDDVNLSFVSNQTWLEFNITTSFLTPYLFKAINVTIETSLNTSVDQLELEAFNTYTNEFEELGSINNIVENNNSFVFDLNHTYFDPMNNLKLRVIGHNSTYNSNYNLSIDSLKFGVAESTYNITPETWPQFEIIGIIEAPTLNNTERYNWYAGFETGADIGGNSIYISYDKARDDVYVNYRGSDYSNDMVTSVLVHVDNPENLSTYTNVLLQSLTGVGGSWSIVDLKSFTLEIRTNVYDWFLWVESGWTDEAVLEEVIAYIEDRGYLIMFALTKSFMSSTFSTIINLITFITNGLLIFAIIIAMIGLALHSLLSTMARRREIGMLRSIGLSKKGIIRTISGETLILALLGVFTGIFGGLVQGFLMVNSMPGGGFLTVTWTIPWLTIIILVATVLITVILSSRFPARWAANLNIIDAVRTR